MSWPTEGKACKIAKIYFSENVRTSKLCSSFCGIRTQQNSSKNAKENSVKISRVLINKNTNLQLVAHS